MPVSENKIETHHEICESKQTQNIPTKEFLESTLKPRLKCFV